MIHFPGMNDVVLAELAGFEQVGSTKWVSEASGPLRKIFRFQALKGGGYSAIWSISLDFVPCGWKKRLQWKRTKKSAEADLNIGPVPELGASWEPFSFTRIVGWKEPTIGEIIQVTARASRAARIDLARVNTVQDVVAIFRERAQMKLSFWFALQHHVQSELAWGLALIAVGDPLHGEQHLDIFCKRFKTSRDDPVLRKAEAEATRLSQRP